MDKDPNRIRDLILQILIDHEKSGSPEYKDCTEIAKRVELEENLVEAYLDVLAEEGYVEQIKTFGGCAAKATSRALVYRDSEIRKGGAPVGGKKSEEEKEAAIKFFEDAFNELFKVEYNYHVDLQPALMKIQHAARLLSWNRILQIVTAELIGYTVGMELSSWRNIQQTVYYEQLSIFQPIPPGLKQYQENFGLMDSVSNIISAVDAGGFRTEEVRQLLSGNNTWSFKEIKVIETWKLERVLNAIRQLFFSFCSDSIKQLRFGEVLESVFDKYRQNVDGKLAKLGIGSHLEVAIKNLNRENPESWRLAALGCRNLLSDLANKLWQAPEERYVYLDDMQLKGAHTDLVKNKLRAWLHQKGLRRTDDLFIEKRLMQIADCLNELHDLASKAKKSIKYEDALSCVMNTYILIGEIAMRTDLEPVSQIQ